MLIHTALLGFGLPAFLAYFIKNFIHPLNIFTGIIHEKFKLRYDPYLVFNARAKFVPDLGSMRFNGLQGRLRISVIKEAQKHAGYSQVGGNPYLGDCDQCIRQKIYAFALEYSSKVLLYYSCKFLLTFRFHVFKLKIEMKAEGLKRKANSLNLFAKYEQKS